MKPAILILSQYPDEDASLITERLASLNAQHVWFDPGNYPVQEEISLEYDRSGLVRRGLHNHQHQVDLSTIRAIWDSRPSKQHATTHQEKKTHAASPWLHRCPPDPPDHASAPARKISLKPTIHLTDEWSAR